MRITFLVFCVLAFSFSSFSQGSRSVTQLGVWDDPWVFSNNGDSKYNDVWGFAQNGEEYAVIGSTKGTHIVQIMDDNSMIFRDFVIGTEMSMSVVHRDFHDYNGYLYSICQQGMSSLQISDLRYLPDSIDEVYNSDTLFRVAHNIFIDTATARMYVCGPAGKAMSIYSLENPELPELLLDFTGVNYVHDAFVRNDTAFLNCGDDGLYVFDFSNVTSPRMLGYLQFYPDKGYNHAGWLSADGNTYIFADETPGKAMKVCDVSDLTDIQVLSTFIAEEPNISTSHLPHNLMYKDGYAFVSHYNDGLQIFDLRNRENPISIGYFDTYPTEHHSDYRGAWGIYSFLPSGRILVSDRQTGLHLFHFDAPPRIDSYLRHGVYPNPFTDQTVFSFDNPHRLTFDLIIYDARGREAQHYANQSEEYIRIHRMALEAGIYFYELRGINNTVEEFGKIVIR
jgi:choice-of-anchor B domain-containing protein